MTSYVTFLALNVSSVEKNNGLDCIPRSVGEFSVKHKHLEKKCDLLNSLGRLLGYFVNFLEEILNLLLL